MVYCLIRLSDVISFCEPCPTFYFPIGIFFKANCVLFCQGINKNTFENLTAIKLDDKLPLFVDPKCSMTCQLLFFGMSGSGLAVAVDEVDVSSVSRSVSVRVCCLKLVQRRPQPLLTTTS